MKKANRNQPRRVARTPRQAAGPHDGLEAKLLKLCADIGWICGWREERLERVPSARRSSRKRVMLGRALAAEARMQEVEAFRPVEVAFVSSRRTAYLQAEPAAEASGFADIVIDLQDELARLERAGWATHSLSEAASRYLDQVPRIAARPLVGLRIPQI
ncbi:hypothetical protein [Lysobacter enzymogenes]|uniref:hypothetical protein n=1 Tax=Lysobacter enzymogenes TaxID=69 RepID=UPI001AF4389B|nr:hypothetical protein [Lysobacter enzymogenes]QQQ01267.1 hypothetical protein JHW41_25050 [Lysobacter enzymogenes]